MALLLGGSAFALDKRVCDEDCIAVHEKATVERYAHRYRPAKVAVPALGVVTGADIWISDTKLRRGGVSEVDPLMRGSLWSRVLVASSEIGIQTWVICRVYPEHPTRAKVLTAVAVGIRAGIVGWGLSQKGRR